MIYINHRLCYPSNFKMPPHLWVWATGADKPASRMNQVQKLSLLILGLQNQTLLYGLIFVTPLLRKWNLEGRESDMGFLFYVKKSHKNKDFPWRVFTALNNSKMNPTKIKLLFQQKTPCINMFQQVCLFVLQRVHSNWISIETYIPSG